MNATVNRDLDFANLVQAESGIVSRKIFVDPAIHELEQEKVFARCWLYLTHESQLKQPGDFVSTYMGEDPVLVVRDRNGRIGAFLNSCRHRGMKLCRADEGHARAFTCTYHGWTYSTDGQLVGAPQFKDSYYGDLKESVWGLIKVPRLETYRGLVFGCWDPNAVSLREYIGDFAYYMDLLFHRRSTGTEVIGGVHKWQIPCNWKFAADNFVGDLYHVQQSHGSARPPSTLKAGMEASIEVTAGDGHGMGVRLLKTPGAPSVFPSPIVHAYMEEIRPEMEECLGRDRANELHCIHSTLFPNFTFGGNGLMRVWMPRGPHKMEIWSWVVVDRDAPDNVKQEIAKGTQFLFSNSGVFEQDDGENWHQCTEASKGYIARQYPFNYQQGLGHEQPMAPHPGRKGAHVYTELNQRAFYKRYRELMMAEMSSALTTLAAE